MFSNAFVVKFWEKYIPDNECRIWIGKLDRAGYGIVRVGQKDYRVHRVAFYLTHGHWPEPMCLHKCDNPACFNPAHLYEGTHEDNMRDLRASGNRRGKTIFAPR